MEVKLTINAQEKMIYLVINGECNSKDLEKMIFDLANEKEFNADYNMLTDLRECVFNFLPKDLAYFTHIFKDRFSEGKGKSAIIVSKARESASSLFDFAITYNLFSR